MKNFAFFMILMLMVNWLYALDETLVKIADETNIAYFKPEVEISPTGDIYVAYQAENQASGRSEIFLSKYSRSIKGHIKGGVASQGRKSKTGSRCISSGTS